MFLGFPFRQRPDVTVFLSTLFSLEDDERTEQEMCQLLYYSGFVVFALNWNKIYTVCLCDSNVIFVKNIYIIFILKMT